MTEITFASKVNPIYSTIKNSTYQFLTKIISQFNQFNSSRLEIKELNLVNGLLNFPIKEAERIQKRSGAELIQLKGLVMLEKTKSRIPMNSLETKSHDMKLNKNKK